MSKYKCCSFASLRSSPCSGAKVSSTDPKAPMSGAGLTSRLRMCQPALFQLQVQPVQFLLQAMDKLHYVCDPGRSPRRRRNLAAAQRVNQIADLAAQVIDL